MDDFKRLMKSKRGDIKIFRALWGLIGLVIFIAIARTLGVTWNDFSELFRAMGREIKWLFESISQ